MKKGFGCLSVILGLSMMTSPVHASTPPYELSDISDNQLVYDGETSTMVHMSIDEAVAYGLEHNLDLKSLENQLLLADIKLSNATDNGKDIKEAKSDLKDAGELLEDKEVELLASKEALRLAKVDLDNEIAPDDIPVSDNITISKGDNIRDEVTKLVEMEAMALIKETVETQHEQVVALISGEIEGWPESMSEEKIAASGALEADIAPFDVPLSEGVTLTKGSDINKFITNLVRTQASTEEKLAEKDAYIDGQVALIIQQVENSFWHSESALDEAEIAIGQASATLEAKWSTYDSVISDASREMEEMIGYNSTITLSASNANKLMVKMASVNLSVTNYAEDIYRNQVAMLIRKDYYDALYAEKILAVKEQAAARGKRQFEMIKLSYDNGMKAKDDYLMAKMYDEGSQLEARLAKATYNNAIHTLKNDMNLTMGDTLVLTDPLEVTVTEENLDEAIKNGLTNRIEIQQSLGEELICELNLEIIGHMGIPSKKSYQETEAEILLDQAQIGLTNNKYNVVAQILQSYELMTATADMVLKSSTLVQEAEEVVTIAQLKYEQGLGTDSALLSSMNLESSGGTALEVLAAQENLTKVQAQVANIHYSYRMAKCKFQNDAAMLFD